MLQRLHGPRRRLAHRLFRVLLVLLVAASSELPILLPPPLAAAPAASEVTADDELPELVIEPENDPAAPIQVAVMIPVTPGSCTCRWRAVSSPQASRNDLKTKASERANESER